MSFMKYNQSYYRYKVTYKVRKRNQTEEIRNDIWDTDILQNRLHFWNRKRHLYENQNKLANKLLEDYSITMAEILEEEFVLVPKCNCKAC